MAQQSAPGSAFAPALDRGGNRQINATVHRVAVTRLRCHSETQGLHRPRNARKARAQRKRSAASNATSHGASGTTSSHPTPTKEHSHPHQSLDIGGSERRAEPRAASSPDRRARRGSTQCPNG